MDSPYVDYLVPNFRKMTDPKVRQALTVSTNAAGVDQRWRSVARRPASPAESIVNPAVVGYQDNPAFSGPQEGDPAAAKQLLEEAGVDAAVPDQVHVPEPARPPTSRPPR